jgi:peptidoglycan hydrolase-like protein with peptidoglycan-binding domain
VLSAKSKFLRFAALQIDGLLGVKKVLKPGRPRSAGAGVKWQRLMRNLLLVVAAISGQCAAVMASDRTVLVLAVGDYKNYKQSEQSVKGGRDIVDAFKAQGFDVVSAINPNSAEARAALNDFSARSKNAKTSIAVLIGHVATTNGTSFLIANNVNLRAPTDLLSQGVAIPSVVLAASQAENAAVFVLATVVDLPASLLGVSARAEKPQSVPGNVVLAFSTSDKVPLSRVDMVTKQASSDLAEAARERPLRLPTLVNAAAAGGVGFTVGKIPDIDLLAAKTAKASTPSAQLIEAERSKAREEAERAARVQAELAARQLATLTAKNEAQAQALAQAQAKVDSWARRDAVTAVPGSGASAAPVQVAPAATGRDGLGDDIASLQVIEGLMGRTQRRDIQVHLNRIGLYNGPIDSVFGPLTRQAIEDFQKNAGDQTSGYLTPRQFQALLAKVGQVPPPAAGGVAAVGAIAPKAGPTTRIPPDSPRWEFAGTPARLIVRGTQRTFALEQAGGEGTVVFEGRRDGRLYKGTAYVQAANCGRLPYPAEGPISEDNRRVTLGGKVPQVDGNCRVTSYVPGDIVFDVKVGPRN